MAFNCLLLQKKSRPRFSFINLQTLVLSLESSAVISQTFASRVQNFIRVICYRRIGSLTLREPEVILFKCFLDTAEFLIVQIKMAMRRIFDGKNNSSFLIASAVQFDDGFFFCTNNTSLHLDIK